jgi:hypothetical protein
MTTKARKRKSESRFNENGLLECQRFIWQIETAAGRIEKNKCRYSSDTRNKKKIKEFARVGQLYVIVQRCANE